MSSSKFYRKSLTLLLSILEMINEGCISSDVAKRLDIRKSHVSYYLRKAMELHYVKEICSGTFKKYELTQPGKNFVAMYQQQEKQELTICKAENVRFKAPVLKMPSKLVDWHKVEMNNWNQYTTEVDGVKVKLNDGKDPTIEFLPAAIDGNDPNKPYVKLVLDCDKVAKHLEQIFDLQIGRLELSSKAEWVIYNPLAKTITKEIGRVTVDGIGMINASLPTRHGEFEFHDPRAAAEFLEMPGRLARLEEDMKEVLKLVKQENSSENKNG